MTGERCDLSVGQFEPFRARLHQQRGPFVQCGWNRGHQHRLLGIGGQPRPQGQVPAALDVARNGGGLNAETGRTASQQVVVFVRRCQPGADVQTAFGLAEIRRQRFAGEVAQAKPVLPELQRCGRCPEGTGPVDGGGAAHTAALQDVDRLVFSLAGGAFPGTGTVGHRLLLGKVRTAAQRASSTSTTLSPALVSNSAVIPAPAPEPTMATSQTSCAGSAVGATTYFPAALQTVADRVSCKLLMGRRVGIRWCAGQGSPAAARFPRQKNRRPHDVVQGMVGLLAQCRDDVRIPDSAYWMAGMSASGQGVASPAIPMRPGSRQQGQQLRQLCPGHGRQGTASVHQCVRADPEGRVA